MLLMVAALITERVVMGDRGSLLCMHAARILWMRGTDICNFPVFIDVCITGFVVTDVLFAADDIICCPTCTATCCGHDVPTGYLQGPDAMFSSASFHAAALF